MKSSIFIPEKIKVGFQKRSDTYTKKLAYVIYYDQTGKLRKETSWDGWRDHKIDPLDFENVPTSGFVLNKKVGDYQSDWNHRHAYVRIYDPRDFEFEITIENLLYILENANSIRGKGLEGEFVYAWDGKDLLLIPTSSPDYETIKSYTSMIAKPESFNAKNMILGATYVTKQDERWIYLGRFHEYEDSSYRDNFGKDKGLKYFFSTPGTYSTIATLSSLSGKIVKCEISEPAENYAELMEKLEGHCFYSPVDPKRDEYVDVSNEELSTGRYFVVLGSSHFKFYVSREYRGFRINDNEYSGWYGDSNIRRIFGVTRAYGEVSKEELMALNDKFRFKKLQQYLTNGKKYK